MSVIDKQPAQQATSGFALDVPQPLVDSIVDQAASLVIARMNDQREYMSTEEAAAYLRWPKKRLDNLCSAGAIPFRKIGNRRLFIRQEIDTWVDSQVGISVRRALVAV